MKRRLRAPWVLLLALASGCAFLGAEEEAEGAPAREGDDRVGVVGEEEPFDPAAAVDDADRAGDASDDQARATLEADREESAGAAPAERRREKQAAVRAAEQGERDDDQAKAELARNPPAEAQPEGESAAWTALDVAFDGLVLAAAALALALLVVFAPAHRRAAAGAVTLAAAVLFFLWRQGG